MIITRYQGIVYRMHSPNWAFKPKSGDGAAINGGRVNRPGLPALYLSLDKNTSTLEYQQDEPLMPPGTLVTYQVDIDRVADFRGGYSPEWPDVWKDFESDWRSILLKDGLEPPSWAIGEDALNAGAKGILCRSQRSGGNFNLILFTDALEAADVLDVFDPRGALPKDQKSWT